MKNKLFYAFIASFFVATAVFAEPVQPSLLKIYDEDGDRIFENLKERVMDAKNNDSIPVVIRYRDSTPLAGTYAMRLQFNLRKDALRHSFRNLPAVAVNLTRDEIDEVLKDPMVEHVELDVVIKKAMDGARSSFGIDHVRAQFGYDGDRDTPTAYSTNDVVVAIIDTGINPDHPDLRNKVLFFKDFIRNRIDAYDDEGHGTFVAGVVAGAGKVNSAYTGAAPGAALVVFKVLDASGSGSLSDGIAAVDEAISRKAQFNIRIINLSLAASGSSNGRDAFSTICNRAVSTGITVVVAAGNEGPAVRTIGTPSAAASVITVGAGADLNERGFYIADFSGRGPTADGRIKPDLWAPGVMIRTTRRQGGYASVNGTSFSTPFVAGVVALMLDANPNLAPAKIKNILVSTSQRWFPGGKNNEAGFGRLQAYQAVTRAAEISSNLIPPEVPSLQSFRGTISPATDQVFEIPVFNTAHPLAITCIILNSPSGDIDLELLSPSNSVVSRSSTLKRQETIRFLPTGPGTYQLRLKALGTSDYLLSISGDFSNSTVLIQHSVPGERLPRERNRIP